MPEQASVALTLLPEQLQLPTSSPDRLSHCHPTACFSSSLFLQRLDTLRCTTPVLVLPENSCSPAFFRAQYYGKCFLAFEVKALHFLLPFGRPFHERLPERSQRCIAFVWEHSFPYKISYKISLVTSLHSPSTYQKKIQIFSDMKAGTRGTYGRYNYNSPASDSALLTTCN